METKKKVVNCPQCGRECLFSSENEFRPFCSERCRLIDLGDWASEAYKVPVQANQDRSSAANNDEESED